MNTHHDSSSKGTKRLSRVLVLLSITALGLAASPTAFAAECGGPGAPSVQHLNAYTYFSVLSKAPQSYASWSD